MGKAKKKQAVTEEEVEDKQEAVIGVDEVAEIVAAGENSELDLAGLEQDIRLMKQVATVDSGHLAVFDPTPIDEAEYKKDPERMLKSHASAAVQMLLRQLQTLPQEKSRHGAIATLPKPELITPREKPIPKPKPLTRWQKFAQEKGIRKQKRSKMEWDETRQEYRPRHGYNRVNDTKEDWVLPHKEAKGNDYDPWEERAEAKRDQKEKQKAGAGCRRC